MNPNQNDYVIILDGSTIPDLSGKGQWIVSYVVGEDETQYHTSCWTPQHKIEGEDFTQSQWDTIKSGLNSQNVVKRREGESVGDENTPIWVDNDGVAKTCKPLPTVSGYLAVKTEKQNNNFTVSINPDNIETWTFTVLDENDEPETITKRVVTLSNQFNLKIYQSENQNPLSNNNYFYGETVEISAPEITGKIFSHWSDNTTIISSTRQYQVLKDTDLTAVYNDAE